MLPGSGGGGSNGASSGGKAPGPALRGLIVDDDALVRDLLEQLLTELGVDCQVAEDGREGENWLKTTSFDLLFLDFNLPFVTGDIILEQIQQGGLKRPGAIVMMSADDALKSAPPDHWLRRGVLGFLAKPFERDKVKAFVETIRSRGTGAGAGASAWAEPAVLVAGSGLWADALTRVVYRGGGRLVEARGPNEVPEVIKKEKPSVAVFGPPIPDRDLVLVVGTIRSTPEIASIAIFAGTNRRDARLEEDLKALGVTAVFVLPGNLARLSSDVISTAGLNTRSHRRAPLAAPIKLQASTGTFDGFALDLSEGGIGLTSVKTKPPLEVMRIEFQLPGEIAPVRAAMQLSWTKPDGETFRVGLRFTALEEADRARIRRYVDARTSLPPSS